VVRALYNGSSHALPVRAVRCEGGRLYAANAFVAALTGGAANVDEEIAVGPGDRFFGLSDSWNAFDELRDVFQRVRESGGAIVTCIFDLIPELYPHACHEVTVPRYRAWLRRALLESDAFLAISRSVAEELADYVEARALPHRPGLKIGWFHCGSDLAAAPTAAPRAKIAAAVADETPVFLMVGTLEPRKGHRVVLAAFNALWEKGVNARLVIVGRRGWFEEAIAQEIRAHREFGRRLFWFDDVADGELAFLYARARVLILASYAEGFGLPIVEAARHRLPVICSDIPVFREVAGAGAIYFRVNDSGALALAIEDFLSRARRADPSLIRQESWADAARRIVETIAREDWTRRLD
ncbi:MAG: glycosyltransferase family 4 protein, partial [Methylocystis sp.]|nr:glycosyltransferase family 4 protein [Methylocystis sp.]